MSDWIYVKKEDIEIYKGDVQVWFESDDFGNRYVTFPVEWIKELLNNEIKNEINSSISPILVALDCFVYAISLNKQYIFADGYQWLWIFPAIGWLLVAVNIGIHYKK